MADIELQCAEAITVVVVTGFLGSGKTSLIREHLRNSPSDDTLVVVNEFGEIGLDHHLLETGENNVYLLDDGCVCCTINDSLEQMLWTLHDKHKTGELRQFSRIIVETSGLTDPEPIIELFRSANVRVSPFRFQGLLTVVDATLIEKTMVDFDSARRQIRAADAVVVTKTDLLDAETVRVLKRQLTEITSSRIDYRGARSDYLEAIFAGKSNASQELLVGPSFDYSGHSDQLKNLATLAKSVRPLKNYDKFNRSFARAIQQESSGLYRFKAILPIADSDVSVVFHGAQGFWAPPEKIRASTSNTEKGYVVAIGQPSSIADISAKLTEMFE
jgi:G3E family GTPase